MRIAIIGAGISGLTSAWLLQRDHEIVLYEASDQPGGHAHTVDVETDSGRLAVDTGFIVFNRNNYPSFSRILDRLEVACQPTEMSFSVRRDDGIEYGGASLNALFAQRSNLLRPWFLRMCLDIPQFYRDARRFLREPDLKLSLGEFVADRGYSSALGELHLLPMCAAIWSTDPGRIEEQPAANLLRFLDNHGLLQLRNRPQWFSISGGSRSYVSAMAAGLRDSIQLSTPVRSVRRERDHVEIVDARGQRERFHHVVIATHSDQALALLSDPSAAERQILGAIRYQPSEAVLHCDTRLLPRSRHAWSSWNYHVRSDAPDQVRVTYLMNRLQRLASPLAVCVSLNETDAIDPDKIFQRLRYEHPLLDRSALRAQTERPAIDGVRRTYYCGAYWGHGFHEDGVRSALDVCRRFGVELT